MRVFGINEANYYCSKFSRSTGNSEKSISEFQQTVIGSRSRTISEGTSLFQQYRDCSLREVERSMFLAASHYRRSLDLMIPSSAHWAHGTLYYGSWYVSHALLGMFGCTILGNGFVIDVNRGSLGRQRLHFHRGNSTYTGSHRTFWDLFYRTVQNIRPLVSPYYSAMLSPISGNRVWQIEKRNEVNYDSLNSLRLAKEFDSIFLRSSFPTSLPGVLGTQFQILEVLLDLVFSYANHFGLSTDSLDIIRTPSPLRLKVRKLIYGEKPPGLVLKTKKAKIT